MATGYDVIIIGAGAAGLMCAMQAGQRERKVLLLDHSAKIGEKIRISGGGRCNFTNLHTTPANFLSQNPDFCCTALSRYTPQDFIALIEKHDIVYHEKKLGQLFCDGSSQQIIDLLVSECRQANVSMQMEASINAVEYKGGQYSVKTNRGDYNSLSLVIATGGLSIPKIGATSFGYEIAKQFGLNIIPTRAALVPLTFQNDMLEFCKELTGISVEAAVSHGKASFAEGLLFTHRGLSGPSILQISSYWQTGEAIEINLAPEVDALSILKDRKQQTPKQEVQTTIAEILPKRLAQSICTLHHCESGRGRIAEIGDKRLTALADNVNRWQIKPNGSEGYRTAEVTLGGVDTTQLSPQTMEAKNQPGLYFIGEVVDVTGHLGGFNFQWAWASGFAAGQNI